MPIEYPQSIAERPSAPDPRHVFWMVFASALAVGGAAAWYYASRDLTLSHYDARAHLVVARRVIDSLTPGWRQLGAVWLPLPHMLNVLPMLSDWAYRTGAISTAISVIAMSLGFAVFSKQVVRRTGSVASALTAPALALLNPNVLYLQATPMTEPLLFALTLISIAAVDAWWDSPTPAAGTRAGACLAALCMTRYEGWLVAGALGALVVGARGFRAPFVQRVCVPPFVAVVAFLLIGRATTGVWPGSESFFVPDPSLFHQPAVISEKMQRGFVDLAGVAVPIAGGLGLVGLLWTSWRLRTLRPWTVAATLAPVLLPAGAFYAGHPFRIRYLIPLVVAGAAVASFAIAAAPRRLRIPLAAGLCLWSAWLRPPFQHDAPMVLEAQWDTPFRRERHLVTTAFMQQDDGRPILASMGSLGHYMQDASQEGLPLRRFVHEGTGDLWSEALKSPARSVRWILIEETAEGGDVLALRARSDPAFLADFECVTRSGGLALYKRKAGSGDPASVVGTGRAVR